jgi:hypothetical protein
MEQGEMRMRERTPGQIAPDEALERLCARGFTAFRNGKIVSPNGHVPTDEDQADFTIFKNAYPVSKLL